MAAQASNEDADMLDVHGEVGKLPMSDDRTSSRGGLLTIKASRHETLVQVSYTASNRGERMPW
jgi:hypothetical protein